MYLRVVVMSAWPIHSCTSLSGATCTARVPNEGRRSWKRRRGPRWRPTSRRPRGVNLELTQSQCQARLDRMDGLPLDQAIGWAERRARAAEPVVQLTAAVELADDLRDVGDELVGH